MTCKFRPGVILCISTIWCYAFCSAVVPLPYWQFCLLLVALCCAYLRTFEAHSWTISLTKKDLSIALALGLLGLFAHWEGLFLPLGGDELYHAEQSAFLLRYLRNILQPTFAATSPDAFRSSMWQLFDLRHMAVIDIWRILSFILTLCILVTTAALVRPNCPLRNYWEKSRPFRLAVEAFVICLSIYIGRIVAIPPEQHPPLRLLPLVASTMIFGLNSFAFRVPGLIVATLIAFWIFCDIRASASSQPKWWTFLMALLTVFVPVVFYVSEAVEPSVFGYAVYVGVILCARKYLLSKNNEWIVRAALIAGLGLVLRQSTVVTWLLVGCLLIASDKRFSLKWWWKVFAPGLLGVPYFLTVKSLGHTAESTIPPLQSLGKSLSSGIGIMSILNSTTLPWAVVTFCLLMFVVARAKWKESSLFLLALPAYGMFHIIWEYLWGLGRYQAEYVAPFIVYALMLGGIYAFWWTRFIVAPLGVLLIFSTIEVNSNLSLDTNYAQWPRMRITSSASFPYREAFGYLKREEAEGHFALIGGSPWYGHMVAWLGGFSFYETNEWRNRQDALDEFVKQDRSMNELKQFCIEHNIRYLVSQTGTRREKQHRSSAVNELINALEEIPLKQQALFFRVNSFSGDSFFKNYGGGILNIYRVRPD